MLCILGLMFNCPTITLDFIIYDRITIISLSTIHGRFIVNYFLLVHILISALKFYISRGNPQISWQSLQYTEDNIRSLDWKEHIRLRPGMYIGKLGDGSSADDGIYILLKETIDNCIDEFVMGAGKTIDIAIQGEKVTVRGLWPWVFHWARWLMWSLK